MLVLGLQGSPRKKGNTDFLLRLFMEEAEKWGAATKTIQVTEKNIQPCREYITCEKKGFCPIDDDVKTEIYGLLREAEVIIPASPVFFYNVTAQLKALIDRSQTLWARKYKLGLTDPLRKTRKGYLLSVGATRGKMLFDGIHLTAKYFFDAVGAKYEGSLTYREIEKKGDMEKHPSVKTDVEKAVKELLEPLTHRKKILFLCRENACRSQMSAAFAQHIGGHLVEAASGGSEPAASINKDMKTAMAEKGIDLEFRTPKTIEKSMDHFKPDMIVTMGCGEACPFVPGARRLDWDLPDPAGQSIEFMRNVRDEIEKRVISLLETECEYQTTTD